MGGCSANEHLTKNTPTQPPPQGGGVRRTPTTPQGPMRFSRNNPLTANRLPARWLAVATMAWLCSVLDASPARAQLLQGQWVDKSERRIEILRKAPLRVILLDANGRPVPNATVRFEQLRHAFAFGIEVDDFPQGSQDPNTPDLSKPDLSKPPFRGLSAVSLRRMTTWPKLDAAPGEGASQPGGSAATSAKQSIQHTLAWAKQQSLMVRYGQVFSADMGAMPDRVARMQSKALRDAMASRLGSVIDQAGTSLREVDLFADMLDHRYIEQRLGVGMLRKLAMQLRAQSRGVGGAEAGNGLAIRVHFADGLRGNRLQLIRRRVTALEQAFVPMDGISIDMRLEGIAQHDPLMRQLSWLDGMNLPVTVTHLQVSGGSDTAAAINFETALRTLFAHPRIDGVYLAGYAKSNLLNPHAALIDDEGKPTKVGQRFEQLTRELWWSDVKAKTDPRGNASARLFAGLYRLTASWPQKEKKSWAKEGESEQVTATVTVRVAPMSLTHQSDEDARGRLIVLQALKQ